MNALIAFVGVGVMILIALALSNNRRAVNWYTVGAGLMLQLAFAVLVLKTPPGRFIFEILNTLFVSLLDFQLKGAEFVFGLLAIPPGCPGTMGFFFAFQVLTTIIFFSSLVSVLYYLGIMQVIILALAKVMKRFLGASGAETLSASANIFVGFAEAPLTVRPFVERFTKSEMLCVMTAGMATVAGGVFGAYVRMLNGAIPDVAGHLLAASVMSAPAAIMISKIMIPETEEADTSGELHMSYTESSSNVIEAAVSGAEIGVRIAVSVGAVLVAFMGLLALVNAIVGWVGGMIGLEHLTLEGIMGLICAPLAWLMGVPWSDCFVVGQLIGEKTVVNEMVAYQHLHDLVAVDGHEFSPKTLIITLYALCGFSNFMGIGIQIAGIGSMAPSRRGDLARLGVRALIGGSLASFITAAIAGVLV